jgi:hypothetical protein
MDAAAARAAQRAEADVDVVGVVGHRERVGHPGVAHEADDLRGRHRALQRQQAADGRVGDRARTLAAEDRLAVDLRDVDAVARGVLGDVARLREEAVAAADR